MLEDQIKANKSKITWQENVIKNLSIQVLDKDYRLDQLESQIKELKEQKAAIQMDKQQLGDPQSLAQ